MRRTYFIAILIACAAVGCATSYHHDPSLPSAQLKTAPFVRGTLCDGAGRLDPGPDGFAVIPAGRLLHLAAYLSERRGYCSTGVRFTPEAGKRYEYVVDATDEQCVGTLVEEDKEALIGIRAVARAMPAPGACQE